MSVNHMYDVLIVGAGPVGLAVALGLYQRGINNILVLDQTHSFQKVGQVVDLLPNGLKALKCINNQAYEKIKLSSYTFAKPPTKEVWNRKNLAGKITYSIPLNFDYWQQQYGEGRVSTAWHQIQTDFRELLPAEMIKINHRCVNLYQKNNLINVDFISDQPIKNNPFAHWEKSTITNENNLDKKDNEWEKISHQFSAKLVVSADGINSTIREILYGENNLQTWAKPQYSGYYALGCFTVENVPEKIVTELENNYWQGERVVTVTPEIKQDQNRQNQAPRIIVSHKENNIFGYLLHFPIPLETIINSSPEEKISLAKQALISAEYPSAFWQLIELSNLQQLFYRPYYLHPADLPVTNDYIWSFGRVVLVGDAAHGMPPFMAQGANQGFEDALMIVKLITQLIKDNELENEAKIINLFQQYESDRRPFISKIQSATMRSYLWTQQEWNNYSQLIHSRSFEF